MHELILLVWRPLLAILLVVLDPLRAIGGLVMGLLARPWWLVIPGAIVLSPLMEVAYVQLWSHATSFNS